MPPSQLKYRFNWTSPLAVGPDPNTVYIGGNVLFKSTDSGATWSANQKLTTVSSNFDGNPNGPGDYSSSTPGIAGSLLINGVWPFFCDHRSTNPETSTAGAFEIYTVDVH